MRRLSSSRRCRIKSWCWYRIPAFCRMLPQRNTSGSKRWWGELPDYVCLVFTEEAFDKKKEKNLAFIEEADGGVVAF